MTQPSQPDHADSPPDNTPDNTPDNMPRGTPGDPAGAPTAAAKAASASGSATSVMTAPAPTPRTPPTAPAAASKPPPIPKRLTCPICHTEFGPRATGGTCPVCGEQVLPRATTTREVAVLSPAWGWLAAGGWRAVLVVLLVIYQVALFVVLLVQFKQAHLL